MPRLQITTEGFDHRVLVLNLGVNRFGRHSSNHFRIEHPTVSGIHCEVILGEQELLIRDCNSTNGTFVDGQRVQEASLKAGQVLRLGDVECLVEESEIKVSIPPIEVKIAPPPKMLNDGSLCCPNHEDALVTHRCPKCQTVMCSKCVHRLRRRGGKLLQLCPLCSNPVELIRGDLRSKRSFLDFLKTVKLPFTSGRKRKDPTKPKTPTMGL